MSLKKVGIVCDDYKVPRFVKQLKDKSFNIVYNGPFRNGTTLIQILCPEAEVPRIAEVCQMLQIEFNRGSN